MIDEEIYMYHGRSTVCKRVMNQTVTAICNIGLCYRNSPNTIILPAAISKVKVETKAKCTYNNEIS